MNVDIKPTHLMASIYCFNLDFKLYRIGLLKTHGPTHDICNPYKFKILIQTCNCLKICTTLKYLSIIDVIQIKS